MCQTCHTLDHTDHKGTDITKVAEETLHFI